MDHEKTLAFSTNQMTNINTNNILTCLKRMMISPVAITAAQTHRQFSLSGFWLIVTRTLARQQLKPLVPFGPSLWAVFCP
jgi:hypothetical protein